LNASKARGRPVSDGFVKIASLGELAPGKMKRFEIDGQRILLANVDGRFYATADTCTHEDASLSAGSLRGELVRCPLHGSRFNVCTGKVLEDPAEQDLKTYPVRVEGDSILVALTSSTR
jgi:3-phenylpropionate/trans-cinnamate dioxygenase ferredoxin component